MLNLYLIMLSYTLGVVRQAESDRPICCLAGGLALRTHMPTC